MEQQAKKTFQANILIVDDNLNNLNLLAGILADHEYKVRRALNGIVALRAIQISPPNLILLDINMPEMNGYEVCQQLKANPQTSKIPVIFISALNEGLDKAKAFSSGGVDYITKPFQLEEVIARIENQLNRQCLAQRFNQQDLCLEHNLKKICQAKVTVMQSEAALQSTTISINNLPKTDDQIESMIDNLQYIERYCNSLLHLIKNHNKNLLKQLDKIQKIQLEIDPKTSADDIEKITISMLDGVEQIRNVMLSLCLSCEYPDLKL